MDNDPPKSSHASLAATTDTLSNEPLKSLASLSMTVIYDLVDCDCLEVGHACIVKGWVSSNTFELLVL